MFVSSDNIWEFWTLKSEFWQTVKNNTDKFFTANSFKQLHIIHKITNFVNDMKATRRCEYYQESLISGFFQDVWYFQTYKFGQYCIKY